MKNSLQWATLQERRFFNRQCMFYKTVNQTMALDIPQYLHKPQIATRSFHQNYFIPIQTNSDAYKFSYFPRTVRFWNLLPSIVVTASSIDPIQKQSLETNKQWQYNPSSTIYSGVSEYQ